MKMKTWMYQLDRIFETIDLPAFGRMNAGLRPVTTCIRVHGGKSQRYAAFGCVLPRPSAESDISHLLKLKKFILKLKQLKYQFVLILQLVLEVLEDSVQRVWYLSYPIRLNTCMSIEQQCRSWLILFLQC